MRHLRWFWQVLMVCAVVLIAGGFLVGALVARSEAGPSAETLLWLYFLGSVLLLGGLVMTLLPLGRSLSATSERLHRLERNDPTAIREGETVRASRASERGFSLRNQLARTERSVAERFAQLQRRQQALQEQEEFLQRVLQTMVEAVVVVDGAQRVLFANRAAYELLELSSAHLRDRPVWEVVRSPGLRQSVQRVLNQEEDVQLELTLPRKNRVVRLVASSLPGQPPAGAVLVLHDITELRRLESLRRDFVSNVSHELKTPLTSIQAYAETLLNGALEDPSCSRNFVARIAEAAERLHTLILDLLALARIEAEEEAFHIQPVSVGNVVEECLQQHRGVANSRQIALRGEDCPEGIFVRADAEGLRTILDNLVDNALNYTLPGGEVRIGCSVQEGRVCLEVSDTGIGIPREHRDRIFERFYRVDRARSRELGGTGLGLAIVKHLVQVFEGEVRVESEPGRGSTFSVFLPLAEKSAGSSRTDDNSRTEGAGVAADSSSAGSLPSKADAAPSS